MTTQFQERPFFGGAITGTIPQGWIDASDLRQVPDHQEIFLSATTLSHLIFEINEYVSVQEAPPAATAGSGIDEEDQKGVAAALYHLQDVCDEGDTMAIINTPRRVQLNRLTQSASSAGVTVSAYTGLVKYTTPKKQRGPHQHQQISTSTGDATAGSSAAATPKNSVASCHFLLVRLPEKETDLLVFVNVPHDEFDAQGDSGALAREEATASELIGRFVQTVDVLNWDLFG